MRVKWCLVLGLVLLACDRGVESRTSPEGIWTVWVDDLPRSAPPKTLGKQLGLVLWKVSVDAGGLTIEQLTPDTGWTGELKDGPFLPIETRPSRIGHCSGRFGFEVPGRAGGYERYCLEDFYPDRIEGHYTIHSPHLGAGPFYGRLDLRRHED